MFGKGFVKSTKRRFAFCDSFFLSYGKRVAQKFLLPKAFFQCGIIIISYLFIKPRLKLLYKRFYIDKKNIFFVVQSKEKCCADISFFTSLEMSRCLNVRKANVLQ